ncbi:MAG: hypothetical protein U0W24_09475 [Bacteroidales bacterium]
MNFAETIDEELVKEQLEKIITSPPFKKSPILSNFLNYVVSKTLNGKSNELKEFVIATEVLKKDYEFNPQLTSLVRIHAKRLRDALENYYLNRNSDDKVIITIPKGRYFPHFEMIRKVDDLEPNPSVKKPAIHQRPYVGVFHFKSLPNDERNNFLSSMLCQDLGTILTRYQEFFVIPYEVIGEIFQIEGNIENTSKHLEIDYLLTVSCFIMGEFVKITVKLILIKGMQQLWAENFIQRNDDTELPEFYKPVIRKTLCMVGGYFGLIYRNLLSLQPGYTYPENSYGFVVYWGHHFSNRFTPEAFLESYKALHPVQRKYPEFSLLSAMIASAHLNSYIAGVEINKDSLQKGQEYAKNAATINPMCQYSFLMLALAGVLNKNLNEFTKSVNEIYRIHPLDPIHSKSIGFGNICLGEYETGFQKLNEAVNDSPFYIWATCLGFCFYYIKINNYLEALHWATKINRPDFVWDPFIRASILGLIGEKELAAEALKDLYRVFPKIKPMAAIIIDRLLFDMDLKLKILEGLNLAGFKS